jgi:hypothetical protein
VLMYRFHQETGTEDLDELTESDSV